MALFKPFMGNSTDLNAVEKHAGYVYFCTNDGSLFFDYLDADGILQRRQLNADEANALVGYDIMASLNDSDSQIPTSKAVLTEINSLSDTITELSGSVATNYNETIIALSVEGTTVTYIKGDGSVHTFETQDTDTTYSLGTDEVTGLTKLYATTGSAEDGTMTQKAIKTELDKKVGVTIDDAAGVLIFTI